MPGGSERMSSSTACWNWSTQASCAGVEGPDERAQRVRAAEKRDAKKKRTQVVHVVLHFEIIELRHVREEGGGDDGQPVLAPQALPHRRAGEGFHAARVQRRPHQRHHIRHQRLQRDQVVGPGPASGACAEKGRRRRVSRRRMLAAAGHARMSTKAAPSRKPCTVSPDAVQAGSPAPAPSQASVRPATASRLFIAPMAPADWGRGREASAGEAGGTHAASEEQPLAGRGAHAVTLDQLRDGGAYDALSPERPAQRGVAGAHVAAPQITATVPGAAAVSGSGRGGGGERAGARAGGRA